MRKNASSFLNTPFLCLCTSEFELFALQLASKTFSRLRMISEYVHLLSNSAVHYKMPLCPSKNLPILSILLPCHAAVPIGAPAFRTLRSGRRSPKCQDAPPCFKAEERRRECRSNCPTRRPPGRRQRFTPTRMGKTSDSWNILVMKSLLISFRRNLTHLCKYSGISSWVRSD